MTNSAAKKYKGAFVIATYKRPEILEKVLEHIYNAKNSENISKVIVFQGDDPETLRIINLFMDEMTVLVRLSGLNKTPLENITNNYLVGLQIAFEYLASDYVIEIEDDSIISPYTVDFINQVFGKFSKNPKFRGINLGSYENEKHLNGTYSILRTGFHATHGVITRRSWKFISKPRITSIIRKNPLDSTVESFWKTGFTVTPNLSLCENYGWLNGTHASSNPKDNHYSRMQKSYEAHTSSEVWSQHNFPHSWQPNPVLYKKSHNLKYFLIHVMDRINKTAFGSRILMKKKLMKNQLKVFLGVFIGKYRNIHN